MAAYFLNLFSPQTYETFKRSERDISGFRQRQMSAAERVSPGDKLICYLTKLGRWFGVLEVVEGPFIDHTPIYYPEDDPFVVRFRVRPVVVVEVEKAIPIREDAVWSALSFTREHTRTSHTWTGKLRASLAPLDENDGRLIEELLFQQASDASRTYPIDEDQYKKLATLTVRRADKDVVVTVPEDSDLEADGEQEEVAVVRESIRIQALLADIGARMGMTIWIPRSDRSAVIGEREVQPDTVAERLPLNYDDVTLSTIENIDVLWLRGRSIVRAFEVEHTTSIYSGILRMADLIALQPNMDIKLHIVAPLSKRDKVFQEIRRPVFSLLEHGALAERCTYLSYDSLRELAQQQHLEHMGDTVLDEYAEEAE
jgi:predicted RNA-binding protein